MFRPRCHHRRAVQGARFPALLLGVLAIGLIAVLPAAPAAARGSTAMASDEAHEVLALTQAELGLASPGSLAVPGSSLLQSPPVSPMTRSMYRPPAQQEDPLPHAVPLPAPLAGAAVVFAVLLIRRHASRRRA